MILYRAMSRQEYIETLAKGRPAFVQRFKWFSPNIEFIKTRVMDGFFNHSHFRKDRYVYIIRFTIPDDDIRFFSQQRNEWRVDRRIHHLINWQTQEEKIDENEEISSFLVNRQRNGRRGL